MTDLEASLMAIGGTFIAGIYSYNKWQEYKAKRSVEKAFSSEHDDVLMNPGFDASHGSLERREPDLSAVPLPADDDDISLIGLDDKPMDQRETVAPQAAHAEQPVPQVSAPAPVLQKDLPVDGLIDCVIPFALSAPIRGEKLLSKLQVLRHVGNKPVHFIGQNEGGAWEPISHGRVYIAVQAGVQLANRSSALNEIEYSELIMSLRQIADDLDAEPDVPDMSSVMATARALHQFISEHDAQLSVNVKSNGAPWDVTTLLSALERQGFDLRPDGRLVMPDGEGGVLFSLLTNVTLAAETTARLTLLLDVPRVSVALDGFGAMVACARVLAARLDGTVVDDSDQPLSYAAVEEIAGQVASFYSHMESSEIPAGSTRALRLFS